MTVRGQPGSSSGDFPPASAFPIPDPTDASERMMARVRALYPICRSITGDGVRETLRRLSEEIPIQVREVPTGTQVFDWTVPREWNCREAWIRGPDGQTVVDFADHNLHLVNYSAPVRARLPLSALRGHLHTLPAFPDRIPYRTSYYRETWGFCLPHRLAESLPEGDYEVYIDAGLEDGALTYGEAVVPGRTDREVLVSCHVCHPSLCNDNLSGITVATELALALGETRPHFSYRFLFIPGTIGSITWLALNQAATARIDAGLVLAGVGDAGPKTYKRSRRDDAWIDRAVAHVLEHQDGADFAIEPFSPYGYDERQFCSPGFNLPVGCLMRTPFGRYDEYHTSADDLTFVRPDALADTLHTCLRVVEVLEGDRTYQNLEPYGEPQLGPRGLYDFTGGHQRVEQLRMALLWVLNQSDGSRSVLAIAERAELPFAVVREAADKLLEAGLLEEVSNG